ncbi:bifunctional peptidase and (3S)-lysyl hydroxylase Jmjd7-like [Saccostrea cucullata]|uniref:bifunctional peptidase and (3S)-lysyl hydroxylase Jmjd7-like n=1 Tax=Saccostrea cuccullata TaxID=36930 RepID=UPI002ED47670
MVMPAIEKRKLSDFMDIVNGISNGSIDNMSAYLQYASIPQYLPKLEKDIREEILYKGLLEREMLNIWLSDGKTLGKLHFDAHDNFLCQISGRKEVILFDPHNNHQLYEGHLQAARLSYNFTTKSFQRQYLEDTTIQVFSPIDIKKPNYTRFPLFGETYPLNCTLEEGDVLYLPSFWWHEVQSFPNITAGRNLAVNFWYEPFLNRDYPCPECQLDVNPKYRHLL